MTSRPAWYAVPGSIWPGDSQPARAGTFAFSRTDITFGLGVPFLRWETGGPQQDWETDSPQQDWETGGPYGF